MSTDAGRLESWKQYSQIVGALAIPLVLAGIGYFVQRSIAETGLKKDYVQMALAVLKDEPTKGNEQLRQWAIAVLDQNSPVPLPISLKQELVSTLKFDAIKFLGTVAEGSMVVKFDEFVHCKPPLDPQTLEWLLKNYPSRFTRCPNGELGEISLSPPASKDSKGPLTGTLRPSSSPK